jgi:hypothetical protein
MTTLTLTKQQISVLLDALDLAIGDQEEYLRSIYSELDYRGDDTGLEDCKQKLRDMKSLHTRLETESYPS